MIRAYSLVVLSAAAVLSLVPVQLQSAEFELRNGLRVVLLGGAMVERMQIHSYCEATLAAAQPGRELVFRNLGWSGDNIYGDSRAVFGTREDGLKRLFKDVGEARPDVVLVAYGANESFWGEARQEEFRKGLESLVTRLTALPTRVVLLTPHRFENLGPPLPNMDAANRRLEAYCELIRQVAAERDLPVLDLFAAPRPTKDQGETTTNGIHLTETGYAWLAVSLASVLQVGPGRAADTEGSNWSVRLDPVQKSYSATGALLDQVEMNSEEVRFRALANQLPFCRATGPADSAFEFVPRIAVEGLVSGTYEVRVDDELVLEADAQALREGVALRNGPECLQFAELRDAIQTKNELYFHRYRPQNETYLFLFRKHEQGNNAVEIPQFDPLIEKQEARIYQLQKPRPHRYTIKLKR